MKEDQSFGIIPIRWTGVGWQFFLVQHRNGKHWAFPKGHSELNESSKEAAERELQEETGLQVKNYLFDQSFQESYSFDLNGKKIHKSVTYWVAEVKGEIKLQQEEMLAGQWLPMKQIAERLTYREAKSLYNQVKRTLQTQKKS